MKLIKQTSLWNSDGNADKVYEIDLCEIGPNRYVVNFRYGRRGGTLKDGTKTAMPVLLQQAEDIFKKLADEKRKGGYRDKENYIADTTETKTILFAPIEKTTNDYTAYLLRCLQEATQPIPGKITKKWPLGRIIWRAGELRVSEAVPFIIPQLTKGNALIQYITCWSLGRTGNLSAIEPLQQVYQSNASAIFVKRMALAALLELKKINNSAKSLVQKLLGELPAEIQSCLQNDDPVTLKELLVQATTSTTTQQQITTVYLLAEQFTAAETAVYEWLKEIKFVPNQFKTARHIFKIAEFREDAPVFSLLAYKFETTPGLFKYSYWDRNGYAYYNGKNYKKAIDELKKDDAGLAYSNTTRNYFMRRTWRTMRTLGEDGSEAYIRFAFGTLLQYNNFVTEKTDAQKVEKTAFYYNQAARTYENVIETKYYAAYPNSFLLNHILFSNSEKYFLKKNNKAWQIKPEVTEQASKRTEAFESLWDKYPQALAQLLFDSTVEIVHVFVVKALINRNDLAQYFDLQALKQLLQKPFAATAQLSLKLSEKMYNPNKPDEELVTMLLLHNVPDARKLAVDWIGNQLDYFFKQTNVPIHLIINPFEDVFALANKWIAERTFAQTDATKITETSIDHLLALPSEMALAESAASHAAKLLTTHFLPNLAYVEINLVQRLLQSKIAPVQLFGAIILLNHTVQPEQFPEGLLSSMIQYNHPQVRQAGITLFGRLPENQLFDNAALVATFCVSPFAEIRVAIQSTVEKLNTKNKFFGQSLLHDLLPYMHRKETFEALHANLYQLFTNQLAEHLVTIEPITALSFLHSRFPVPQLLGLFILKNYNKANALSMRQWVRVANHEVFEVRQFCWDLFNRHIERIKKEANEALRILDSTWDDSRSFAFNYFRKYFDETTWTPELLVSVCDSTRFDVQSFGREMITKFFKEENGELYLMQLSQHPTQQVQHFTTHYLEQFAADKPLNIEKLEAYFITVLSQVNKAGVAKKRIFHFLKEEALKNKQVATTAIKIIARQSATMAVADKAACIGIMYDLQKKYQDLDMPLSLLPVSNYQSA